MFGNINYQGSCSKSGGESTDDSGSGINTLSSSQADTHLEQPESPISRNQQQQQHQHLQGGSFQQQQQPVMATDSSNRTGLSQNPSALKQPQEKVNFSHSLTNLCRRITSSNYIIN